jgi:hypothetical protein
MADFCMGIRKIWEERLRRGTCHASFRFCCLYSDCELRNALAQTGHKAEALAAYELGPRITPTSPRLSRPALNRGDKVGISQPGAEKKGQRA